MRKEILRRCKMPKMRKALSVALTVGLLTALNAESLAALETPNESVPRPAEAAASVASDSTTLVLQLQDSVASDASSAQDWTLFDSEVAIGSGALNCRDPRGLVIFVQ